MEKTNAAQTVRLAGLDLPDAIVHAHAKPTEAVAYPPTPMKTTFQFSTLLRVMLLLALVIAGPVSAATLTWTNSAGGNWNAATNWSPQQVPGASDVAVINGAASYTILVTGNRPIGGLVLDNPNATLRLMAGGTWAYTTLTVAGGFENQGTIELTSDSTTYYAWLKMSGKTLTNAVGGVLRVAEGSNVLHYINANLDNRGPFEVARNVNLTGSQTNSGAT